MNCVSNAREKLKNIKRLEKLKTVPFTLAKLILVSNKAPFSTLVLDGVKLYSIAVFFSTTESYDLNAAHVSKGDVRSSI